MSMTRKAARLIPIKGKKDPTVPAVSSSNSRPHHGARNNPPRADVLPMRCAGFFVGRRFHHITYPSTTMVAMVVATRNNKIWFGKPNIDPMWISIPQRVSFAARLKSTRSTTSKV